MDAFQDAVTIISEHWCEPNADDWPGHTAWRCGCGFAARDPDGDGTAMAQHIADLLASAGLLVS